MFIPKNSTTIKYFKYSIYIIVIISALSFIYLLKSPPQWQINNQDQGLFIYDRYERLLQIKPQEDQRRLWITHDQINPHLIHALLCLEDESFYQHWGVPWQGIIRAIYYNLRSQSLRYGGSGLTQQVVKIYFGKARNLWQKLQESLEALHIERHWSKKDILSVYMNQVYFANHIQGIALASQLYFNRTQSQLSSSQAAYLMALPNAPTLLNPLKNYKKALPRQKKALHCMYKHQWLSYEDYQWALQSPIQLDFQKIPFEAPHLLSHIKTKQNALKKSKDQKTNLSTPTAIFNQNDSHQHNKTSIKKDLLIPSSTQHHLNISLDLKLQKQAEIVAYQHVKNLHHKGIRQVAAVALDNQSGEVLFWIGSHAFNDPQAGQVDRVLTRKQPGSTLKPFLYALALSQGFTPLQTLPNHTLFFPTKHGQYRPRNYNRQESQDVPLAFALGNSLNIPAVWMLNTLGPQTWLKHLHRFGIKSLDRSASHYGLGLALGNGEVSLIELCNAYRVFANLGVYHTWSASQQVHSASLSLPSSYSKKRTDPHTNSHTNPQPELYRVIPAKIAQLINFILSQDLFRKPTFEQINAFNFPFEFAVKTGTTQGHALAWTIGYSTRFTVGVWVGADDGQFMHKITGSRGAAPLWARLMSIVHDQNSPKPFSTDLIDAQVHKQLLLATWNTDSKEQSKDLKAPLLSKILLQEDLIKIINPPLWSEFTFPPQRQTQTKKIKVRYKVDTSLLTHPAFSPSQHMIHWTLNQHLIHKTRVDQSSFYLEIHQQANQLCAQLIHESKPTQVCTRFTVYLN
jgi:penicillin-binding protein 1C